MILCSCNVLTRARLIATAKSLAEADPTRPVTLGRVFRALGARPQCGGCADLVRRLLLDSGVLVTCPDPVLSGMLTVEEELS